MKKVLLIIVFLFLVTLFPLSKLAEAHIEERTDDITAVLHTEPHEPKAGHQTSLHFTLTKGTLPFRVTTCDCSITISADGKLPYTVPFNNNVYDPYSVSKVHIQYMFPQTGRYKITLSGKPKTTGDFKEFTITWEYDVKKIDQALASANTQKKGNPLTVYLFGAAAIVVLIGGLLFKKRTILFT